MTARSPLLAPGLEGGAVPRTCTDRRIEGLASKIASVPVDDLAKWVTKADRAYEGLRQAILTGVLEPKEQINPKGIAAELGMSVIPVREALRRLEQEGLIVIKPHVGATVRELPVAELRENLLIRSELEALAARLAAPLMTKDVLAVLQALIDKMDKCIRTKHYEQFGALNRRFHMAAYDVIPERGLLKLIEQQWDQVPRAASVFALVPEHAIAAQEEHLEIFAALKRGDAEAAANLTRDHKLRARVVQITAFDRSMIEDVKATA
jgi:DNA-binding GntR family transcriptional regulator